MRSKLAAAGALMALAVAVGLGQPGDGAAEKGGLPPDLARIPARGAFLVSYRVADIWNSRLGKGLGQALGKEAAAATKELEETIGLSPSKVERATTVYLNPLGPDNMIILVAATEKLDRAKLFARLKRRMPDGKEGKLGGQTAFLFKDGAVAFLSEKAFAIGGKEGIRAVLETKPGANSGLASAARLAAGKHSIVLAANPGALPPIPPDEFPKELEPFKPLLKAKLATLTLDLGAKTEGHLRVQFADGDAAAAGLKALQTGRTLVRGFVGHGIKEFGKDDTAKTVVALLKDADDALRSANLTRDGGVVLGAVRLKLDEAKLGAMLVEATARVRLAALRLQSQNNLKQIALAMHNYEATLGTFPPQAVYSKDGKPLLSWRVLILPYIEEDNLYRQFKLDEAWDGPNNKKLLARMPKLYQLPGDEKATPNHTRYLAFAGKGAFFEGKRGFRFTDFTDGTSNTLMVVEAARGVPWSKPDDLPFDPKGPLPKLSGLTPEGFHAAFADGSVRFIRSTIAPKTLRAMITRNGGEVLPADD